jgi:adenosylcobinamide kinase/adenosylcobinamide-phosphate guanylyltransferase
MDMSLILIGGGSRSGKSRYALNLARKSGGRIAFIATARAEDEEMRDRIRRHQEERGPEFTTIEEPVELASRLISEASHFDTFVVDCLTLWLSNHLLAGEDDIPQRGRRLIEAAVAIQARVLLVTNEVGCGIVPENALARRFRDLAGALNQDAAAAAVEVYWMVFGIPLKVK